MDSKKISNDQEQIQSDPTMSCPQNQKGILKSDCKQPLRMYFATNIVVMSKLPNVKPSHFSKVGFSVAFSLVGTIIKKLLSI